MSAVVADTHALIWYFTASPSLSSAALSAFETARAAGDPVWVPSICLVELTYLTERFRLPMIGLQRLRDALADPSAGLRLAPLDLLVADAITAVARDSVPDMPDRIIAATAVALQLPLITADARIRSLQIPTIW
jgi:PIN domain nuclease of toxin-antitoxin system